MTPTEPEVRRLRDNLYGPCSEENWAKCRGNWMKPANVEWLTQAKPV